MNRKTWTGKFRLQRRGASNWVLREDGPEHVDVFLTGGEFASPEDETAALARLVERVEIEWNREGADVILYARPMTGSGSGTGSGTGSGSGSSTGPGTVSYPLKVRNAFVHEPRPLLYASLPLEVFSPKAQAFWRRIFWIVKLPGGRALLRLIARRARA